MASTSTVALSRITLTAGTYWMRSNWKGLSVVPEAITVKLLGAFVDTFCNVQRSQLLQLVEGMFDESKANPLIKQLQEGTVEAPMLEKLPFTDKLEPKKKIRT